MIVLTSDPVLYLNAAGAIPPSLNLLTSIQGSAVAGAGIGLVAADGGFLPPFPPLEEHPYRNLLPMQNHATYVIGTFPPISYLLDDPALLAAGIGHLTTPAGTFMSPPGIPFYHGNALSMWSYVLPPGILPPLPVGRACGRTAGYIRLFQNWQQWIILLQ